MSAARERAGSARAPLRARSAPCRANGRSGIARAACRLFGTKGELRQGLFFVHRCATCGLVSRARQRDSDRDNEIIRIEEGVMADDVSLGELRSELDALKRDVTR